MHTYLESRSLAHEIIVVSNGSRDKTAEICRDMESHSSWFRFFELNERGVGPAFCEGVRQARYDSIVCLDADLSSELIFIDYASDLLRHADMVIGSKTMGRQRRSLLRVVGSQLYILIAGLAFDLTLSDYSLGCKAFRKSSIINALPHIENWTGYVIELCLYLQRRKRHIVQVGINCEDSRPSRFNLLHEGLYRYYHLFKCWRLTRCPNSWINSAE